MKEEVYQVFDFDPTEPVDAFTVTTSTHRREVTRRHFHLDACQDAAFHDALMPSDPTATLSADTSDRLGRQERVRILSWNPGFARGRMSAIGDFLLGPWHIVALQVEASTLLRQFRRGLSFTSCTTPTVHFCSTSTTKGIFTDEVHESQLKRSLPEARAAGYCEDVQETFAERQQ